MAHWRAQPWPSWSLRHGRELLGRNHPQPRFPLIAKFLDARQTLSVQVHPNDAQAARLNPPDSGKTEAWIILEAEAEGLIYAGLKPGVDRPTLESAILEGRCEDCLHSFHPQAGDCVFLPAGTVHSMGAGILAAEIQQSSATPPSGFSTGTAWDPTASRGPCTSSRDYRRSITR